MTPKPMGRGGKEGGKNKKSQGSFGSAAFIQQKRITT
jgi:hypothetical protein